MCGYILEISSDLTDKENFMKSNSFLVCRGPDDLRHEIKNFNEYKLQAIFNRLAIQDLSENAMQPMFLNNHSKGIFFNGEIYNFKELKNKYFKDSKKFKTKNSDSELLLFGLATFGIEFVHQLKGQFAIAYLDFEKNKMYLIRDRVGQKPLFYYLKNNRVIVSSNLKSIVSLKNKFKLNKSAVVEYIQRGVVSSPNTIESDIYKLCPGQYIEIDMISKEIKKTKYWSIEDHFSDISFKEEEFLSILQKSIEYRLISDVPVSNFLSGGLDSTALLCLTSEKHNKINSFSIYSNNPKYDESRWIKEVLQKVKTNHTYDIIDNLITFDIVKQSIEIFDEPYFDPSNVPSYVITKEMAKKFKVAISGDGGDELLGGYERFFTESTFIKNLFSKLYIFYPSFLGTGNIFKKNSKNFDERYESYFDDLKFLNFLKIYPVETTPKKYLKDRQYLSSIQKSFLLEYEFYLSEMMMLKVDRTSMANSLEVRSPFVDNDIIEYIASTNLSVMNKENKKYILKNYLSNFFSYEFINRQKKGFVFGLEDWVFSNKKIIIDQILLLQKLNILNIGKYKLNILYLFKTRINAHRIFKLFILSKFIEDIEKNC